MSRFLLLLLSFSISISSFSQASDFIRVKKRNNRTMKAYFPGSLISCQTVYGNYLSGMVTAVKNDSVFIKEYDIRSNPNMWGVSSVDTMGSYLVGVPYQDIKVVDLNKKESFGFVKNGSLLIIGGLGYAALNVINGKYLKESITGRENRKSLGIALGVAGVGYLMNRVHKLSRKRYIIEYVRMKETPKLRGF
jgi:hypothetical protein